MAPESMAPESMAPTGLSGSLTIWHSYGSGAGTEATALKTVTDKIMAANPDLKLTDPGRQVRRPVQEVRARSRQRRRARPVHRPQRQPGQGGPRGPVPRRHLDARRQAGQRLPGLDRRQQGRRRAVHGPRVPQGRGDVLRQVEDRDPAGNDRRAPRRRHRRQHPGRVSTHTAPTTASAGGRPSAASSMDATGKCVADTNGRRRRVRLLPGSSRRRARNVVRQVRRPARATSRRARSTSSSMARGRPVATRRPSATTSASPRCPAGPKGPSKPLTGVDGWYINTNTADSRRSPSRSRSRWSSPRTSRSSSIPAGHIPADTTIHDQRSDHAEVRRSGRHGLPAPAGARARQLLGQLRQRVESSSSRQGNDPPEGRDRRLRRDEQGQRQVAAVQGLRATDPSASSTPTARPRARRHRQHASEEGQAR